MATNPRFKPYFDFGDMKRLARAATRYDILRMAVLRAIEAADGKPGDAQRALRELRDTFNSLYQRPQTKPGDQS